MVCTIMGIEKVDVYLLHEKGVVRESREVVGFADSVSGKVPVPQLKESELMGRTSLNGIEQILIRPKYKSFF